MAEYTYRAARTDGQISTGTLEAASREDALARLRADGLIPLALEQGSAATAAADSTAPSARASLFARREKRITHADITALTSALAIMLRAGLALDRALSVQIEMSTNRALQTLIDGLLQAVKAGKPLSQALAAERRYFGDFYLGMVRSGEAGGSLAHSLSQLAAHLERSQALRSSIVSALVYPAILLTVAVLSVAFLLGFVVPQFASLFSELGEALPLPTRLIIGLGDFIGDWFLLIALALAGGGWLLGKALATPRGRTWKDRRLLALPVFGVIARKYQITRFARTLGTLLEGGVAIVTAIEVATATVTNSALAQALAELPAAIKQGQRMSAALSGSGLFTPLALNMIRLGEETGKLAEMLLEVARIHDGEVEAATRRALSLLEPAIIVLLGIVLGAIIAAILMGILSVNDLAL